MKEKYMLPFVLHRVLTVPAALLLFFSCSAPREQITPVSREEPRSYLPQARIYRTTRPCAELVPVSVNPSDGSLRSFPAPADLRDAEPMRLADGWWLDRRGIGSDTRFTNFTYSEYRDLPAAPSPQLILDNMCSDCRVAEIYQLPMSTAQAQADTAAVNRLIEGGLQDCVKLFSLPVIAIPKRIQ